MDQIKQLPVVTIFFTDLDRSDPRIAELKKRFQADVIDVFGSRSVEAECEVFPFLTGPKPPQPKE